MVEIKENVVVALIETIPAEIGVIESKAIESDVYEKYWIVRATTETGSKASYMVKTVDMIPLLELPEEDRQLSIQKIIQKHHEPIIKILLEKISIAHSKLKALRKQLEALQLGLAKLDDECRNLLR
jgi:hypothetical protein